MFSTTNKEGEESIKAPESKAPETKAATEGEVKPNKSFFAKSKQYAAKQAQKSFNQ
jgi:hypothetical protein